MLISCLSCLQRSQEQFWYQAGNIEGRQNAVEHMLQLSSARVLISTKITWGSNRDQQKSYHQLSVQINTF
jgi:hypothetical protein